MPFGFASLQGLNGHCKAHPKAFLSLADLDSYFLMPPLFLKDFFCFAKVLCFAAKDFMVELQ